MPPQIGSVAELVATVDGEWARLLRAADALGAGRQEEPLLEGGWSARDVLGHVRLYDAWLLGALVPGRREPQEPYRGYLTEPEDLHRRNRLHLERDRALPAAEVRRSAEATHALVRDALGGLTDADLARTYTV